MAKRKKRSGYPMRVTKHGTFECANDIARAAMRKKGLRVGDLVFIDPMKPRDPKQWGRAHKLGELLIENIDDFANCPDAHYVLKRLQVETGLGCELMEIRSEAFGIVQQRIPKSLNFGDMDDCEFNEIYAGFCQHIIDRYWPTMTQEEIEQIAKLVGMAA